MDYGLVGRPTLLPNAILTKEAQMDSVTLLRQQLHTAQQWLEGTMADVTSEQAHWTPPGVANPLGATYAHAVASQDAIINGMLRQTAPMVVSTWASRSGMSEPMPMPGPDWAKYGPWTRSVHIDLPTQFVPQRDDSRLLTNA